MLTRVAELEWSGRAEWRDHVNVDGIESENLEETKPLDSVNLGVLRIRKMKISGLARVR